MMEETGKFYANLAFCSYGAAVGAIIGAVEIPLLIADWSGVSIVAETSLAMLGVFGLFFGFVMQCVSSDQKKHKKALHDCFTKAMRQLQDDHIQIVNGSELLRQDGESP